MELVGLIFMTTMYQVHPAYYQQHIYRLVRAMCMLPGHLLRGSRTGDVLTFTNPNGYNGELTNATDYTNISTLTSAINSNSNTFGITAGTDNINTVWVTGLFGTYKRPNII